VETEHLAAWKGFLVDIKDEKVYKTSAILRCYRRWMVECERRGENEVAKPPFQQDAEGGFCVNAVDDGKSALKIYLSRILFQAWGVPIDSFLTSLRMSRISKRQERSSRMRCFGSRRWRKDLAMEWS